MRIWVDGQCLQTASRVRGIGRYVTELMRGLAEQTPRVELTISFNAALVDEAIAARSLVSEFISPCNIHVWQGAAEGGEVIYGATSLRRLSELAIAHHVACLKPDIALCASPFEGARDPTVPLLLPYGHDTCMAAIFFDAIPHRFPEHYLNTPKLARFYERRLHGLQHAKSVLAISEFTKKDASELIPGSEVTNIGAGVAPHLLALATRPIDHALVEKLGLTTPFVLYVGGLDWRKNVTSVIQAFGEMPHGLSRKLQFVIVGDSVPVLEEHLVEAWRKQSLPPDNLKLLGYVESESLVQLYRQCSLLVQPSLMEGFGLTALEAMACGTPVLAAAAGAPPEVVGSPDALFDPRSPLDIAKKVEAALTDDSFRASLVDQGLRQAKKFNWGRSADLALKALQRAVAACPTSRKERSESATFADARKISSRSIGALRRNDFVSQFLASAEPRCSVKARLLVDVTSTCRSDARTGIQRVVKQTVAALMADADVAVYPSYCDSTAGLYQARIVELDPIRLEKCPTETRLALYPGDTLLMLDSSWGWWKEQTNLFRRARLVGCEIVTALYDFVPLRAPAFCTVTPIFNEWFRNALAYSDGFVCISRAVADEFLALLAAIEYPRAVKVGYWRLGADLPVKPITGSIVTSSWPEPMFLMVGTIEPRKGYRLALDAFTALWREGFLGSLCIVGRWGWETEQLAEEMRTHPEFGDRFFWLEDVTDGELQELYTSCTALIAASYLEGFGLPLVEASLHGKPIIASNIPVFRETEPAATFFEVGSAESLLRAIRQVISEPNAARRPPELEPAGISWEESASHLKKVILGPSWYRNYKPQKQARDPGQVTLGIGEISMRESLLSGERCHRLELIGDPVWTDAGKILKFTIKVSNLSDHVWSSMPGPDGDFGIVLVYRLLGARGRVLDDDTPSTPIPFVLLPNDYHYLAVKIDAEALDRNACFVEFEILQKGMSRWGEPLRMSLAK